MCQATVYDWYRRFQSGDESLEDKPRSGRPSGVNAMEIKESVEQNSHQSVREIASHLEISKSSIDRHLHALGKVPKLGKWVPHSLSEYDKKGGSRLLFHYFQCHLGQTGCQPF